MKALIICVSTHHGNTEKVAEAMAEVLKAKVVKPEQVGPKDLEQYDLVGFGSGIYMDKPHRTILEFVEKLPDQECRKAFIFSTSGLGNRTFFHSSIRMKMLEKRFSIVGEFACKGWDTFGPLKMVGGINRGKPDEVDLKKAKEFARKLL